MPPAGATWLGGDALNNGTIKDYLKRYRPQEWPEVTKLTLIYGIVALQHSYEGRPLNLQQLQQAVERSNATVVVQRNVPQLQRQILQLQSQLDNVFDKIAPQEPASTGPSQQLQTGRAQQPQRRVQLPQQQQQQQHGSTAAALPRGRQARVCQPAVAHPKPSDAWRQGEASGFTSPPRAKAHPLRRSIDNQGATIPIYPDWWLSEPDAQRGADQQQQQRLTYPLPGQRQQAMTVTDQLAAQQQQFISGNDGQHHHQWHIAREAEPTLLLSQGGDDSSSSQCFQQLAELTLAQQGPARTTAVDAAGTSRAASAARGRSPAAVMGRGLPSLKHVESKIKQLVAASRQKAAAQQQQRHRLLSSVVATSSSRGREQQQQPCGASAEEACPPAATADHFISNPWTSWFVPGAPADLSVPAAAAAAAAVAAHGGGSSEDARSSCSELGGTELVQLEGSQALCGDVAAGVAACSRSVLQDITGDLNQPEGSSGDGIVLHKPACAGRWGLSASSFSFAPGSTSQQQAGSEQQLLHDSAAAAAPGLQWAASEAQQPQQRPWAADFGHLETAQLDAAVQQAAVAGAARRRAAPQQQQQRQQWRQRWVGDYGHLEGVARPPPFSHHQQQADADSVSTTADDAASGAGASGLFLSPADLHDLLGSAAAAAAAQHVAGGDAWAAAASEHEAGTGGLEHEAADYATMAAAGGPPMAAASPAGLSCDGDELLRLHVELRATDSPTKRAAAAAMSFGASLQVAVAAAGSSSSSSSSSSPADELGGAGLGAVDVGADDEGEADLAGSFLGGLGETSAMLRAALAQHSSVMQLVGMLDGMAGSTAQAVAAQEGLQQPGGQQEAAEHEQEDLTTTAEWSRAAAQTAAWVAATAAAGDSAASNHEEASM